jgi:hypothetical protein
MTESSCGPLRTAQLPKMNQKNEKGGCPLFIVATENTQEIMPNFIFRRTLNIELGLTVFVKE